MDLLSYARFKLKDLIQGKEVSNHFHRLILIRITFFFVFLGGINLHMPMAAFIFPFLFNFPPLPSKEGMMWELVGAIFLKGWGVVFCSCEACEVKFWGFEDGVMWWIFWIWWVGFRLDLCCKIEVLHAKEVILHNLVIMHYPYLWITLLKKGVNSILIWSHTVFIQVSLLPQPIQVDASKNT